jgi:hypothetical protein
MPSASSSKLHALAYNLGDFTPTLAMPTQRSRDH